MKVTFVLPPFDLSASYGSSTKMKRGFLPSLGVGHLAACLEEKGHTCTLMDSQVLGLDVHETASQTLDEDPDVICISVMSVYAHASYVLANELKARAPERMVILGGPHITTFHKDVMKECSGCDVAIPGEGEVPLTQLVERLSRREEWREVAGITYRGPEGEAIYTGRAEEVKDLDSLPHPARHIYRPYPYRPLPNQTLYEPATTSISSRGCSWGKCTFCFQSADFAPAFRRRSPKDMLDEIEPLIKDEGMKEIVFWDDTFAVDSRWIDEFCTGMDNRGLKFAWSCYGHMRGVRRKMLQQMADHGCHNLYYGFESGVQEILDLTKKGTTLDEMRKSVKWAKEAGMEVRGSMILGMPTETPEMSKASIDFACELNADWMMFYPFHLHPGTPIEKLARSDGYIMQTKETIHFPSYLSSGYSNPEELEKIVRYAYIKYYLRPRYIMQALWNCRRPAAMRQYFDAFKFWCELVSHSMSTDKEVKKREAAEQEAA